MPSSNNTATRTANGSSVGYSRSSRVSKLTSRHSGHSVRSHSDVSLRSGASRSNASLSNASLSNPSLSDSQYSESLSPRKKKSSFSFKSIRKSLGGVAAFGGLGVCKSSASPKMRFSKLNSPELEALSFPTSTATTESICSSCEQEARQVVEEKEEEDAQRHPIPLHTCALIAALTAFFLAHVPSWESLDQVANIDTFTNVVFEGVPLTVVIVVRLALAAIMLGNALSVFLYGEWYADTDYFPGSKLKVAKRIPFKGALVEGGSLFGGIKCISTFTLWCWIVEGTAFFLAGMIPLFHFLPDTTVSPWVLRTAMILWEVGAPVSILVSAVVKYALWPMAMEHGENVKLLKATGALLQHNLNSIAALLEVGLLGGLPVRLCDFAFPPLYGILYLLYTYLMMYQWTDHDPKMKGPQFFYPFFDTTLGATTSLALLALLGILSLSFCIFVGAEHLLLEAEKFIAVVPMTAIVLLSMMVCRYKD